MSVHMTWPAGCSQLANVVGVTTVPWNVPSDSAWTATAPPLNDHTPSMLFGAAAAPLPLNTRTARRAAADKVSARRARRRLSIADNIEHFPAILCPTSRRIRASDLRKPAHGRSKTHAFRILGVRSLWIKPRAGCRPHGRL